MQNGDYCLFPRIRKGAKLLPGLLYDRGDSSTARPGSKAALLLGHVQSWRESRTRRGPGVVWRGPVPSPQSPLGAPYFPSPLARSPEAVSTLQAQERRGFPSPILPQGTAASPVPQRLGKAGGAPTFTLISIFFPVWSCTQIICCFYRCGRRCRSPAIRLWESLLLPGHCLAPPPPSFHRVPERLRNAPAFRFGGVVSKKKAEV